MRTEEEREALVGACLSPPRDKPREEALLVRSVGGRVPHHQHDGPRRVEAVCPQDRRIRVARARRMEDVALRPARHDDQLARHLVVPDEVVPHAVVLDEVPIETGKDDPLPHGVVPARDVPDERQAEPPACDEERDGGLHLEVREHDCRPVGTEASQERRRHVAQRREVPPVHRAVDRRTTRERADAGRIEQLVAMTGTHPLQMEPMAVVEPNRKGVVADAPIEPAVGATPDTLRQRDGAWGDVVHTQGRSHPPREARLPRCRCLSVEEEHRLQAVVEPAREPVHDTALHEHAGRERIGEHEPHRPPSHGDHPERRSASSHRTALA